MSTNTELILPGATAGELPVFQIATVALQMRERALDQSALIGKVENAEQNNQCVAAKKSIKSLLSLFESERKQLKEPLLEAGRQLDRVVATEKLELEKEMGRLENLEKDFIRAEQRRVAEEQRLQQIELDRIEAERVAALATATTPEEKQIINENADAKAYVEARPVEMTRAKGQGVRDVWVIDRINDFQLMKVRPDLVRKIEWDLVALKQALDAGPLPGVKAHKDIGVTTRGARNLEAITV